MMGYALIRDAAEALGRRWGLGPDVYFLRLDELDRFPRDRSALAAEIPRRRLRWQALQRLDLPELVDSNALDDLGLARSQDAAAELAGTAMAPGVATGVARIVHDPQQAGDLGIGYVLVCASTDPGWTPLFLNARGLVVERGGVLSHGAIVARDFGIPAVACPDATRRIRDGATIRVDGNGGRVIVVDEKEETADTRR
jgi:pyruvate,water dikinase